MHILKYTDPDYAKFIVAMDRHADPDPQVESTVRTVITDIRKSGNRALLQYIKKFDRLSLKAEDLRVTDTEFANAERATDRTVRSALRTAHKNVAAFAKQGLRKNWSMRNAQGGRIGERFDPLQRVGIYVPGGTAPLVSTAIMTVTFAAVAHVPEIVVMTPASSEGVINPALLFALKLAGATEVYRAGGAQAIASLAYGTETIRPVVKIFGPGNAYVVEAKRQVFGRVAIDSLPGPSEILIIADTGANPDWIAADLLAQAEHGRGSIAGFLTPSHKLLQSVKQAIESQLPSLSRGEYLRPILEKNTFLIQTKTLDDALALANAFAPEHLSLCTKNAAQDAKRIRSAGAIFLGNDSPVAAGDFVAGPSHTLPTGGAGKAFPGLTTDQFQRRTSMVQLDAKSIRKTAPLVEKLSRVEGLDAHGRSATIRLAPLKGRKK